MLCKGEVVLHTKFICKNLTVLQYKIYKTENAVIANRQTIYIKKTKKGQRLEKYMSFFNRYIDCCLSMTAFLVPYVLY